jgi:hypothetical protein
MSLAPEDQPTINEILVDFGISYILGPIEYDQLLAQLEERDNVLRADALDRSAGNK